MAERVGFQLDVQTKKSVDEVAALELRLQNVNRYIAQAKKEGKSDVYKSLRIQQKELQQQVRDTNKELKTQDQGLGDLVDKFRVGGVSIGEFKTGLANTQKALGVLTKATKAQITAQKILKVLLVSSGVGALIIALGSLVAWLTQTQQGMNLVARAGNAIKAVIDVLIERAATFGEGLVNIFSGKFREGFKQLGASIKGIGADLGDSVRKTDELTLAEQRLVKVRRDLQVETSKVRAREKELSKIAEDTSLSAKERAAAAAEGIKIEQELFKKREALLNEEIQIERERHKLSITTDEDLQKLADLESQLNDARTESVERVTTLNSKLNTSNQAMNKLGETMENIVSGSMEDFNTQLEKLNKELAGGDLTDEEINQKVKQIIALEKQLAELEAKIEAAFERARNPRSAVPGVDSLDPTLSGIGPLGGIGSISQEEDPLVTAAKEMNEKLAGLDEERAEKEAEALELRKQMIEDSYGVLGEISGQYIAGEIKTFQDFAKQAGGIFFDLAAAQVESLLAPILARLTANLGVPAGPIASAAIIGIIKGVLKGAKSKLEDGGILNPGFVAKGPRHYHGGIPLPTGQEIEGGEPVLTRRAAQLFPNAINAINMASGGRRILQDGGILGGGSPVFGSNFFSQSQGMALSSESIDALANAVRKGAATGLRESVRAAERDEELLTRNVA